MQKTAWRFGFKIMNDQTKQQWLDAKALAAAKPIPEDLRSGIGLLQMLIADLEDVLAMALKEDVLPDFKAQVALWRRDEGPEPDWQGYRDQINELVREEGYPPLFPAIPTVNADNASLAP